MHDRSAKAKPLGEPHWLLQLLDKPDDNTTQLATGAKDVLCRPWWLLSESERFMASSMASKPGCCASSGFKLVMLDLSPTLPGCRDCSVQNADRLVGLLLAR